MVIPFVVFVVVAAAASLILGPENRAQYTDDVLITTGVVGAVVTWRIGRRINRTLVRVTDAGSSSENYEHLTLHSFYWIPFEYWVIPQLVFAALIAVYGAPVGHG